MKKIFIISTLILSLVSFNCSAQKNETKTTISEIKKGTFPKPIGYVNDFERIFTTEQKDKLENTISNFENLTTNEIVIVTIESIYPYKNIKDYSTDLANNWGVGKKGKDNGLVIVFSKRLRLIQISTGNSTEKILTDEICKSVLDQKIIPELKNGNIYGGIEIGLAELIAKWK